MTSTPNDLTPETKEHSYLNLIHILLWAIFFLPIYLLRLVISLGTTSDWWVIVSFLSWQLFSNLTIYVLISLIVLISAMAALVWGHKGQLARLSALLVALSVIALPWLFPYEPALEPAPAVTMKVVTPPLTPIGTFVKMMNVLSQDVPCEYDLLGWSTENQLYYRSECGAKEYVWFVDPERADAPVPITALSSDIMPKSGKIRQEVPREEVLEMVRARTIPERSVRELYLRDGSFRSPNGEWIAIKSQHLYGPQDVMLIKAQ